MLNTLRAAAAGWVAKVLMGVLVLSFAVWGVNDVFRGFRQDAVAEVGDTEITTQAFQSAYRRELSAMADRLGRQLTRDEARALGVDRRVLGQLLTSATLINQARALNLRVSDEYIARQIILDTTFYDTFGRFDRGRFEQLLAANGYSEAAYTAEQERSIIREQLRQTVTGDLVTPNALFEAFRDFQGAKRVVEYFTVPAIDPATIGAPSDDTLTALYNENKARFTTPELRALKVLALEPADLAPEIDISDEDIEHEYNARRHEFETKEKRAVDQLLFPDAESANAAHEKIAAGEDFLTVAQENGFSASDVDLGVVTQADIVDPTVAAAAFALTESEVSAPVQGALGSAIVRVRSIEPAIVRPLDEVRGEIRDRLALERAIDEVQNLYGTVEDERAAERSFDEIADTLRLRLIDVPATDERGRDANGEPIAILAENPEVLRVAFDSDIGIENDVIDTRAGGYMWVEVTDVTAPEAKPFEQIRDDVVTLWREREIADRQRQNADELVARGREGSTIAALAESAGAELMTSEPLTRRSPSTPFAPSLIEAIFASPVGTYVRGSAREGSDMMVVRIAELQPAEEIGEAEAAEVRKQISAAFGNDIFEQYVSGVQAIEGVTVNSAALSTLFGDDG